MQEKEYGGYIELESFCGEMLHKDAIALNCGRNAVVYLQKAKKIKKMYLPYFLCSSVTEAGRKSGMEIEYYHIGRNLCPQLERIPEMDEYVYIVNYYGQFSNEQLAEFRGKYKNIIVDNAQSYFQMPLDGVDTIYTCRKYFGVPDGAFLYTDTKWECELQQDESFERMHFLLGRYERGANEFYDEYVSNNKLFCEEPVKAMSKLTRNLLRGIRYQEAGERRCANFAYLDKWLGRYNQLSVTVPFGAFMYPLFVENGSEVRRRLLQKRIYIPVLWPNVLDSCRMAVLEYQFALNILPLPVDQRYDVRDMEYITEEVKKCIG